MIGQYKFEVCTPAGRRRYLEVLARYVLADPNVDCWQLWQNTEDVDDVRWMEELVAKEPRVRLVRIPDRIRHPVAFRIHKFFPHAADPGTVYVRCDDDVVWIAPGALTELARECILRADSNFLVYGNVLNSGITSHLHQRSGKLTKRYGLCQYDCMDEVSWKTPEFTVDLHRRFLANPDPDYWRLPNWELWGYERHSINVISWKGWDSFHWAKLMDPDEEHWLAHQYPQQIQKPNFICGSPLFVHYAFYTQREVVDATPEILEDYRKLAGL